MKVFVTGGTGFIGSHFLKKALEVGFTVVAQRRPGSQSRLPLLYEPQWIDRSLDGDFSKELSNCDAVVHLAAHTPNFPYAPLDECLYWNVFATIRFLQQAASVGVKNVIVAGTCFEYGAAAEGLDFVHPATEMRPSMTYPISKAAATTACLGLARHLNLRLQVLRIFQAYGEGESPTRFWPSLRAAALKGLDFSMSTGDQVRDFINASEVAEQFIHALNFSDIEPGHPILRNVGLGKPQTLLEFAKGCWDEWGATGKLIVGPVGMRQGELKRLVANIKDVHIV